MLESYDDIRRRIPELPKWFDENGVPRYDDTHPSLCPDIYANEVLFYEIACQSCDARFIVEESWSRYNLAAIMRGKPDPSLSERVRLKHIHYGDPPCWDCAAGATMNCNDIRTVQFWSRLNGERDWLRFPELEGLMLDDGGVQRLEGELAQARALLEPLDEPSEWTLERLIDQTLSDLAGALKRYKRERELSDQLAAALTAIPCQDPDACRNGYGKPLCIRCAALAQHAKMREK